ncbi:helix-turn-helix domain-containing GNAT family N-acetyltransferase [Streptomonospora salina]|uniref:L-amino acid N-acyltransferase YncA/DNA-binding transcriptional ArsR family regulator n=1 Tax=Streptomonospora salina TaxID=104205 RepID=A0A841ECL0_9ACTN|nr:metalloregulator ArsR/SmtB family transcription factor [Streptomonospora salina]MBB5998200.1 L-amino acid N-acyltransferase YncA/DNA-binding transcriptional ArsR family regulator [Streptomonospora salina]
MTAPSAPSALPTLAAADAETYAAWFACLAEPARVRLLHTVASAPAGATVGELAEALELRQSTVSHHLRKLADVGFVTLTKAGTSTRVMINPECCTGLPHAADAVMGLLASRPCCPVDLPADVSVRAMEPADFDAVRRIYAEGIATGIATFETEVPPADALDATWFADHRWIAEIDGETAGWAAAAPVSTRAAYAGVAETSVYVAESARGRGVGKALLHRQVTAADAGGLWTLQNAVFPENKASLALHHNAGFRTLGVRERVARHHGAWRDTVMLERRRDDEGCTPVN